MNLRALPLFLLTLLLALLTACTFPVSTPEPTPTPLVIVIVPSPSPIPPTVPVQPSFIPLTPIPIPSATATPQPGFCSDARVTSLLDSFASALASSNGELMASLISPAGGVDVRYIRDGRVVNYDRAHFQAVFASTYQVTWGNGAGSGLPVVGSFQQIVLPSLRKVFTPAAQRVCNQIKLGGATYAVAWPAEYASLNYFSVHFPGTDQYGGMDWQTWLAGFETASGQPFLRALLHFEWEP